MDEKYAMMTITTETDNERITSVFGLVTERTVRVEAERYEREDPYNPGYITESGITALRYDMQFRALADGDGHMYTETREIKVDGEWVPAVKVDGEWVPEV